MRHILTLNVFSLPFFSNTQAALKILPDSKVVKNDPKLAKLIIMLQLPMFIMNH